MYTLNVQIDHVQDMRISAVINTIKKVFIGHPVRITMSPEVGFFASLKSFLPSSSSVNAGLGISVLSYCSLAFVIYRVYAVVKTVSSFIPFMSSNALDDIHDDTRDNAHDSLCDQSRNSLDNKNYFGQKVSFKIYFHLVQLLDKLKIRFLLPYDKNLEERALFVYSKIFADE